jgi:hypothetical protein
LVLSRAQLPPYYMDFERWLPIMQGYEHKSVQCAASLLGLSVSLVLTATWRYFATPATTLVPAVLASFDEILHPSVDATFAVHEARSQRDRDRQRDRWADGGCSGVRAPCMRPLRRWASSRLPPAQTSRRTP